MPSTGWIDDLQVNDENWVALPGGELNLERGVADEDWMLDCVRTGSRRLGDYTIQEVIDGPWGVAAEACAIIHAIHGDQNVSLLWEGVCPTLVAGPADLELVGNSSVTYLFTNNPAPFPDGSDNASMAVRTIAYGIWLKPVVLFLPPRGILPFPDPEAYGAPPDAEIVWESESTTLWKVEIADAAGSASAPDPDSRYAVNHDRQPLFTGGAWQEWQKGVLPGDALAGEATAVFPSEAVDIHDKTWHELAVPAALTEDYLNDAYDYGVAAGPAEAFEERDLTATRTASTSLIVKAYVRSPRFKFTWGTPGIPPRRIFGRSDGATHGAKRVLGGGNTRQSGSRTLGSIL
jgi:hypothetical protein